ncbi:DUF922 domain-containing Zn-dependent protease [Rhizobium sp. L1K21]|uniref:DUF922 domain-containing Zn-dependent protease n=1 Tax=Rhizobium sp. L1K21 TaxID=2954933 RepID=UPI0020933CC1|nr:DUF922 domain-containing protein [Rhizobium sp. L1K21]MCO6186210.1 DUF922 domain-containing protein [Rhizobium sp. L1K21]
MINSTRRFCGAALLIPFVLTTCGCQANAETSISKSYSYFNIGGKTPDALDRELATRGPKSSHSGQNHPGLTQIRFTYEMTYSATSRRCTVSHVKVNLNVKIILPRWRYRNHADADLRFIWDTLSSDIKRHEDRHAEIARSYARKMEKILGKLGSASNCEILEARAEELVAREIAAHDREQNRFDKLESSHFEERMIRLLKNRSKHVSR